MGNKWNKNIIRLGITITISVCACLVFNEVIKEWKDIVGYVGRVFSAMSPFIIGIIIAFLLNPIMIYIRRGLSYFISKKLKKSDYDTVYKKVKTPSLIITLLLFIGLLTGFLWLVIPRIYESLTDLVDKVPGYLESAQQWVEKMFAQHELLEGKLSQAIDYLEENVFGIFKNTIMPNLDTIALKVSSGVVVGVKAVFNFLIGLIVCIYLLTSKDILLAQAKKIIYCVFSKKTGNKILQGAAYANSVFGGFINGKIIDSIIIGILCFVFTSAIGMEYAVLISVIVGVTNIIPFFGPFIGAVPGALLALMDDPIMFVIFIIWIIILQQFDGNILGPLILGDATGLSGVWVLVAILVGGDLFGVTGMILGVPVFACIYAFIAVQLRDGLRKKNLSSKTEDYFMLKGFDEKSGEPIYRDKHEKRKTLRQKRKKLMLQNKLLNKMKQEKQQEDARKEKFDMQQDKPDDTENESDDKN
ncbi:MAG: AI-2E family transporter [Wujia sp.]